MRFARDRTQIATVGGTLLAVAGLVLTLAGARTPGPGDSSGEVFAWVNERPITGAQLEQAAQRLTATGGVGSTDAERRSLVQLLVDEELLLQRAESLGVLQADPGVRKAIVRATINGIVEDFLADTPSQQQLQQFFQEHRAVFERPARLTVTALYFESTAIARQALAGAGGDWAGLTANSAAQPLRQLPSAPLPAHMLRRYLGPGPTSVALSLEPGEISPPVPGAGGVFLLQVIAKLPPAAPDFADIAPLVRQEYLSRGRELALTEKLASLWRDADVQLNSGVEAGQPGEYTELVAR
jgi:hypothetical protein